MRAAAFSVERLSVSLLTHAVLCCVILSHLLCCAVLQLPGVVSVSVSLLTQQASVVYEPSGPTGPRDILDTIQDAGFDVSLAPAGLGELAGERQRRESLVIKIL